MFPTLSLHGSLAELQREVDETGGIKKPVMQALINAAYADGASDTDVASISIGGGSDGPGKYFHVQLRISPPGAS